MGLKMSWTWRTWRLRHRRKQKQSRLARRARGRRRSERGKEKKDQTIKRWKCRVLARMSVGVAQCGRLDADKCEKKGEERKQVEQVFEVLKEWRNERLATAGPVDNKELTLTLPSGAAAVPGAPWSAARAGQGPNTASRHFLGAPIHWGPRPGETLPPCFPGPDLLCISKTACRTGTGACWCKLPQ